MKTVLKLTLLAAVAALAIAAPAGAVLDRTPPLQDPATGNVELNPGFSINAGGSVRAYGRTGTIGHFRLMLGTGLGHMLVYRDPARHLSFRMLTLDTIAYLPNAVRITGVGLANGKRVNFTAVAVQHRFDGLGDRFGLIWNHKAMLGGVLQSGSVKIVQIKV